MEKSFAKKKKKNSVKFCSKILLGPTGQEFWPEYNVGVFAQELVDSVFWGPRNTQKKKKKKNLS